MDKQDYVKGASSSGTGPPLAHPQAAGLEAAIATAVKDEFSKRAGSGGGGSDLEKRLTVVEAHLNVIEKTMVTGEDLQRELGSIKSEVSKIPFETIKWLLGVLGIAAAIATAVYNIWFRGF